MSKIKKIEYSILDFQANPEEDLLDFGEDPPGYYLSQSCPIKNALLRLNLIDSSCEVNAKSVLDGKGKRIYRILEHSGTLSKVVEAFEIQSRGEQAYFVIEKV